MTETRTRISGDYLKPNFSGQTPGTTTTRRVYGDCYGRSVYREPSYSYSYRPFFLNPSPAPVLVPNRVTSFAEGMVSAVLVSALLIGTVALLAAAPICHNEEVCTAIGLGLKNCHLERVCNY